ncbi:unnamed protein product, partial [Linum tenue]
MLIPISTFNWGKKGLYSEISAPHSDLGSEIGELLRSGDVIPVIIDEPQLREELVLLLLEQRCPVPEFGGGKPTKSIKFSVCSSSSENPSSFSSRLVSAAPRISPSEEAGETPADGFSS